MRILRKLAGLAAALALTTSLLAPAAVAQRGEREHNQKLRGGDHSRGDHGRRGDRHDSRHDRGHGNRGKDYHRGHSYRGKDYHRGHSYRGNSYNRHDYRHDRYSVRPPVHHNRSYGGGYKSHHRSPYRHYRGKSHYGYKPYPSYRSNRYYGYKPYRSYRAPKRYVPRYSVGGHYNYGRHTIILSDYDYYGLYAPPHGYHWVRDHDRSDAILASVATGAVIGLVIGVLSDQ